MKTFIMKAGWFRASELHSASRSQQVVNGLGTWRYRWLRRRMRYSARDSIHGVMIMECMAAVGSRGKLEFGQLHAAFSYSR